MREESEFVPVGARHSNYTIIITGFVITLMAVQQLPKWVD